MRAGRDTFGVYPAQKGQRGGWPGSRHTSARGSDGDTLYLFGGSGYGKSDSGIITWINFKRINTLQDI